MQAARLTAVIPPNREVILRVPDEIPVGEAEILVLAKENGSDGTGSGSALVEYLASLHGPSRAARTKEDIDRQLREERDSWE